MSKFKFHGSVAVLCGCLVMFMLSCGGGGGSSKPSINYTGLTDTPVIGILNLDILTRGAYAGGDLGSSGAVVFQSADPAETPRSFNPAAFLSSRDKMSYLNESVIRLIAESLSVESQADEVVQVSGTSYGYCYGTCERTGTSNPTSAFSIRTLRESWPPSLPFRPMTSPVHLL